MKILIWYNKNNRCLRSRNNEVNFSLQETMREIEEILTSGVGMTSTKKNSIKIPPEQITKIEILPGEKERKKMDNPKERIEYKVGDTVWFQPNMTSLVPIQMKIIRIDAPGDLVLEEGEVLYVLQDENEIISDATFMDIYPVEKEEK
jgi:hypothetical protein